MLLQACRQDRHVQFVHDRQQCDGPVVAGNFCPPALNKLTITPFLQLLGSSATQITLKSWSVD
jgi:hypothetical protein